MTKVSQVRVRFARVDVGTEKIIQETNEVALGVDVTRAIQEAGRVGAAYEHEQIISLHPFVDGPVMLVMIVSATQT